jgi:membrane protein DedA with SNARE-associated domain
LFGWLAFILWETYWLIEIADQFKKSEHPLQLPYFFLIIVMVVIPYSIFRFSRRRRRPSAL